MWWSLSITEAKGILAVYIGYYGCASDESSDYLCCNSVLSQLFKEQLEDLF
jgi:hypothetical protein